MRKVFLLLSIFGVSCLFGADFLGFDRDSVDPILESTRTISGLPGSAPNPSITLAKPGSGIRNCITDISFTGKPEAVLSVWSGSLSSPTTMYSLLVSSGALLIETWYPGRPICAEFNSTMTVTALGVGGTYYINVEGFTKRR